MSEVGQHYPSSDTFGPFRPIQAQILPDDGIEMFYQPGETLFGPVAMPMRELGWAVFPQDRDGQRKPAAISATPDIRKTKTA